MTKRRLHSSPVILITAMILLSAGCSPSPKYYGRPRGKSGKKTAAHVTKREPLKLNVTLSPPVKNYRRSRISSYYGERRDPRYNTREFHYGIDIRAAEGDEAIAAAAGTVIFSGRQRGFGKVVIIEHGDRLCTVYAHLSSLKVKKGSRVQSGDPVGRIGRTGNATGVHLHFEVRKEGKAIDPLDYL